MFHEHMSKLIEVEIRYRVSDDVVGEEIHLCVCVILTKCAYSTETHKYAYLGVPLNNSINYRGKID
jgi:hypothetical protein